MPPSDDPTDTDTDAPRRTRVSGAQLMEEMRSLPDRIAERIGNAGGSSDDDDTEPDTGNLPPEVTFEGDPEPTPEQVADTEPPPVPPTVDGETVTRRKGFPRRRR